MAQFDTKEIVIGGTEWKTAPFRFSKMFTLGGGGSATVEEDFITQSGDTIVTSAGTPLALVGISSLTSAPSITDTQLTFADDGQDTVSFSMQQLKDYVSPAPAATTLHQYDRVDGKATVAGFWTDGGGQRYAVCVVDAAYRSGSGLAWSTENVNTPLRGYYPSSFSSVSESGTYNTDTILTTYTPSKYPAFNFARNACTVSVDNKTFESCLPNMTEVQMLFEDDVTLDNYDATLSSYPERSLVNMFDQLGTYYAIWTSNEANQAGYEQYMAFARTNVVNPTSGGFTTQNKSSLLNVCPIIEIPVDENGTVITN